MIVGYARVSTDGQTLDARQSALMAAGAEKVYSEKQSGAKTDRARLAKAIATLADGDCLIVTKLDRLARSTRDLLNTLFDLPFELCGEGLIVHSRDRSRTELGRDVGQHLNQHSHLLLGERYLPAHHSFRQLHQRNVVGDFCRLITKPHPKTNRLHAHFPLRNACNRCNSKIEPL